MNASDTQYALSNKADEGPRSRIAFIQACWHRDIVDRCKTAFLETMQSQDYALDDIDFHEVPGVFEIPLYVKMLAQSGKYAGIVAAGLIVNGGIYRHDFVSTAVINGLMQVQLETGTPVFSAVLTPHNFHSSEEHVTFFRDHFLVKGVEVAKACVQTVNKIASLATA